MTSKEIRDLSPAEIATKIREIRETLLQARMRKQTGQVEKTHELRVLRKDIARLETILRQKNKPATAAARQTQSATSFVNRLRTFFEL